MQSVDQIAELILLQSQKQTEVENLKAQINNIDATILEHFSDDPIVETYKASVKFFDSYPFFTRNTGASGTIDTGNLYCFASLSGKTMSVSGSNYALVWRPTIPRSYQTSNGTIATAGSNYPGVKMGAGNSIGGHFVGSTIYNLILEQYKDKPISVVVKEQEDMLQGKKNSRYPTTDFSDLLQCGASYNESQDAFLVKKTEIQTQLSAELATKTQELADLTEQILAAKEEQRVALENIQTQLQEKQEILDKAQAQLQEKEQELERLVQENAEHITQKNALDENITKADQNIKDLTAQIEELKQNTSLDLENLREQLRELLAQKQALQAELESLQLDSDGLNAKIAQASQEKQALEAQAQEKQTQKETLEAQLQTLENQKTQLQDAIASAQEYITQNAPKKTELEEQIAQLTQVLNNQNGDKEALEGEITELQAQKEELERQIQDLVDPTLIARRDQLKRDIKDLNEQIAQGQELAQNLQAEIARLEKELQDLQAELQTAQSTLSQKEHERNTLRESITPKQEELENLQHSLAQATQELENLKAQNQELENNLTTKRQEFQTLQVQIDHYDVNALNAELQTLLAQIPQKQKELEEINRLIEQNKGNKDTLDAINSQILEKQKELEGYADSEIYKAQQELEKLKNKLDTILNTNSFVLEQDLKDLHTRAINLAKSLKITICEGTKPQYPPIEERPANFEGYVYIAHDGERLDSIVYAHYGTLEIFQSVLVCNPRLLNRRILIAGERVYLPYLNTKNKMLSELWS